ncbi:MAG TPA: ParB/RepB/Spo0J family partition protein [Dehalococcoidia bacterium]|nr:ParB/RepB/Spo0J family partition protein [Dehalococcoidia bacterium]
MPDIELKSIQPNRLNPRLEFTKVGLDELADSIKQVGLLEPIIVRPRGDHYEVVVGERRYRAAQQAGLDTVSAIVRDYTDDEVIELNLVENIHREDLSHVEKGNCAIELMQRFPNKFPSKVKLAKSLGVNDTAVNSWIQAAQVVPKEVQAMIAPAEPTSGRIPKGKISGDMAVTIARQVKDEKRQIELADELRKKGMPKSQARQVISQVARQPERPVKEIFRRMVEEAPIFLPFSKKHADDILIGRKMQTSRKGIYPNIKSGRIVRAAITHFADLEILDVHRKKLSDFDENDAQREGGYSLEEFKNVWKKLHGQWNPNEIVSVIEFRLVREVRELNNTR